jgi:LysM repeat protein
MNTPNPLIPQGTSPDGRGKSHVRIAVFTILAIHVMLLGALLMAGGCKKTPDQTADKTLPPDTNTVPPFPGDTNTPVGTPNTGTGTAAVTPTPTSPALPVNPVPQGGNVGTPSPVATTETPATPAGEHVIVKGDTLGAIAKKYHVSLKAIQDANPGVVASKLKVGQKINVPAAAAPSLSAGTTGTDSTAVAGSNGESTYTVKSGDTLWALAKKYSVKESAIRAANNLKTGALKVGQKLKIPAKGTPAPSTPDSSPSPLSPASPSPAPVPAGQ